MTSHNPYDMRQLRRSLPRSAAARILIGVMLMLAGILGFLPILGFWMIPLGLAVLAIDIPAVRRARRRLAVRYGKWRVRRKANHAKRSVNEK